MKQENRDISRLRGRLEIYRMGIIGMGNMGSL